MTPSPRNDLPSEIIAELFASRGLGRRKTQVRMTEELFQKATLHFAAERQPRIAIKRAATARKMTNQRIDDHISGSSIERDHSLRRSAGRNNGDVSDPAYVQRHAAHRRMAINEIIDKRHERRSLSPRGHVGRTKICRRW